MRLGREVSARAPTPGELRAFVVVAEELHFARAARRLAVTPPSLSQAIRRLEEKLAAVLFERTPRSVVLTPAGVELLPRARDILARMVEARAAVNTAADDGPGTLVIGIAANGFAELTLPILSAFRSAHPRVRMTLRDITGHPSLLASGVVDVTLVRPPVQQQWDPRIRFDEIVDEPRIAVLPADHPLVDAVVISIADIADEVFVEVGPGQPRITDYWAATDAMGGVRPRLGTPASTVAGVLQAVAYLGDVVTSIPSVLRFFQVPGLASVPLNDVAPATMAVCTRAGDENPLTADFRAAVRAVSERAIGLVPGARFLSGSAPTPPRA